MNLGDLKSQYRLIGADAKRLPDPDLIKLFNRATVDIAKRLILLQKDATFDVVSGQDDYQISAIPEIDDFLVFDKDGLWFKNLNNTFQELDPYTRPEMNRKFRSWRDEPASIPIRYFFTSDTLTVHPKPNASQADGFLLHYGAKPVPMAIDGDFPFGSTDIAAYEGLDASIFNYVQWKTRTMLAKSQNRAPSERSLESIYKAQLREEEKLINRRWDLVGSVRAKMKVRRVGHAINM